jgi:maltose/moltooligosaccharide transporter
MPVAREQPRQGAERLLFPAAFDAVIFDMDGVLTQTAALHSAAWKRMFDEFLAARAAREGEPFREFTHAHDYRAFVDGRPRYQGVDTFLRSRGIRLPAGEPSDPAGSETVCGLGNRKNEIFNHLLTTEGAAVYASTLALMRDLRARGVALGLATSSRNAGVILARTATSGFFGAVVDGLQAERLGLPGKPAPDIFLAACAELGVPSSRAIVVEDAASGVAAGARGGFALTLGVAREGNGAELLANGADAVVADLAETDFHDLTQKVLAKRRIEGDLRPAHAPSHTVRKKPRLNAWQLWNMSFGYVGIQFGFALQNANVSRIFATLGAKVDQIPLLWIAAPVSGLLVQPVVGYLSDKTWCFLGRRKPYFLVSALLASAALLVMPNSPGLWFAAGMLWIMDASINVTMEPMRAFVGDMLPDEQRTTGFAVQTFFIGVSSVVGSLMPYLLRHVFHVANSAAAGHVPPSVKWSFYSGGAVYLLSVLWTVFSVREYSPEEQASFHAAPTPEARDGGPAVVLEPRRYFAVGGALILAGLVFSALIRAWGWDQGLYILSLGAAAYGLLQIVAALRYRAGHRRGLVELVHDVNRMPEAMRQLALAQMFTWFALFAFFIYATAAVTAHQFGSHDPASAAYNAGADWVGVLMAVYNGVAALAAFLLAPLARRIGRVGAHMICLVIGGCGLLSMDWFHDYRWLIASMVGLGIAWASLLTMPYAILSSAVPFRKMGVYMGMFNFFIVIPQILAAAILGLLVRTVFHGQAILAIVLGGLSMIVAAGLMTRVRDRPHQDGAL